jgi:HAD superfamily hydrolase (TIGR01509 family)
VHSRTKLEALRHFGLSFSKDRLEAYVGRTSRALFADAIRENGSSAVVEEVIAYKHRLYLQCLSEGGNLQTVQGTPELIAQLGQAHIPMAVASSAGNAVIEAVLRSFDLRQAFQIVVSGAELPKGKPDPAVYLLAADRLGVQPQACVVLEDAAAGVQAAKRAGMYCIAYRNPGSGQQNLSLADDIVEDIRNIDIRKLL